MGEGIGEGEAVEGREGGRKRAFFWGALFEGDEERETRRWVAPKWISLPRKRGMVGTFVGGGE